MINMHMLNYLYTRKYDAFTVAVANDIDVAFDLIVFE